MKNLHSFFFCCLLFAFGCFDSDLVIQPAQEQIIQVKNPSLAHFRGVQALSDSVVWISGTGGTVLFTENGGKKWKDVTVPNLCQFLLKRTRQLAHHQMYYLIHQV